MNQAYRARRQQEQAPTLDDAMEQQERELRDGQTDGGSR